MMYGTAMAKGMKEGGKKKAKKKNYGAEKAAVRTGISRAKAYQISS